MASLDTHLINAKKIATLMDNKFSILGFKFGLDPILNILPGFGNVIGVATSLYIFWIAYTLRLPNIIYLKMAVNIILDYVLGIVPLLGIIFDLVYKANIRNLRLIENYLEPKNLKRKI